MKIHFYKASMGDCFLLDFENEHNTKFVIDTGTKTAFQDNILEELKKEIITGNSHLFVTHIDDDHIGGLLYLCKYEPDILKSFKCVYYNSFDCLKSFSPDSQDPPPKIIIQDDSEGFTSYKNGKKLESFLDSLDINLISQIKALNTINIDDIAITFLSPSIKTLKKYKTWIENNSAYTALNNDYNKSIEDLSKKEFTEDDSETNGSSISMLIEYKDYKMLFLGDSFPTDIVNSLKILNYSKENKLKVDLTKISHHGSRKNTSNELLELIKCRKFLISTDGKQHYHPDKESLSRIICSQERPCLIFNYDVYNKIFSKEELSQNLFYIEERTEVIL